MNSDAGNILGVFAFLTSSAGLIYAAINHKRIRCRCCGKDIDMSVDVDPTDAKPKVKKPGGLEETVPVAEPEVEPQPEPELEPQIIQYVEPPPKRNKKSRVYPG